MKTLKTKSDQNTHQNAPNCTILKKFLGEHCSMPPNPPSKAHGEAMRSMSFRDMQISKSDKKILSPPLPNPGYAPASVVTNGVKLLNNYYNYNS